MAHSFKYKPSKVKWSREQKTVDEIHKETIEKFDDINNQILKTKQKIYALELKLEHEENQVNINDINMRIKNLKKEIEYLNSLNDEMDYFEKTRDILLKYYKNENKVNTDTTEIDYSEDEVEKILPIVEEEVDPLMDRLNELNIINNKTVKEKKTVRKKKINNDTPQTRSILSFLSETITDDISITTQTEVSFSTVNEKGTLKDQYLSLTDSKYMCEKVKLSPIKVCQKCNLEKTLIHSEGIYVCQLCGTFEYVIIESEVPSHKDSLNEKPKYPYKTINHLIERLTQFQAKQTTIIPPNIYKLIDVEMKKMQVSVDELSPTTIKKILKKYRLNLFYEHSFLIYLHVTNSPPPSLTRDEEDEVKKMFRKTEIPFKKYKPKDRANYLNYSYVLHKIFLIMGELSSDIAVKKRMDNNSKYFHLLKSRDKLRMQDLIWKNICRDLEWPYHPSF